jgi:hypothetical protein
MSTHPRRLAVVLIALVTSALPLGAAKPPADLAGVWILNKDRSDDPGDKDRSNPKRGIASRPGLGGAGPMGGAGVSGPLMGGGRADPVLREQMREISRLAFARPERLTVTTDGDTVRMVDDDGHLVRLRPDGSKVPEIGRGGVELERKTRWEDGRLVTEVRVKDGASEMKQVYTREGPRLTIQSTFEGEVSARSEKMKLVYDLEER